MPVFRKYYGASILGFDYRLTSGSPAIGAGDASLSLPESSVDYYGLQRGAAPDLGAYVYRDTPQSN